MFSVKYKFYICINIYKCTQQCLIGSNPDMFSEMYIVDDDRAFRDQKDFLERALHFRTLSELAWKIFSRLEESEEEIEIPLCSPKNNGGQSSLIGTRMVSVFLDLVRNPVREGSGYARPPGNCAINMLERTLSNFVLPVLLTSHERHIRLRAF